MSSNFISQSLDAALAAKMEAEKKMQAFGAKIPAAASVMYSAFKRIPGAFTSTPGLKQK